MSRFEWITSANSSCSRPVFDREVAATEHFVVLPTLGSLVPGWLLVVPRRPIPNMSHLTEIEQDALDELTATLSEQAASFSAEVFYFEHGGHAGSSISCGVDQAHLHIVPLPFDLIDAAAMQRDVNWEQRSSMRLSAIDLRDSEYLMVASRGRQTLLGRPLHPTSQWFRRLIASQLGRAEEWDYRQHPALDVMDITIRHFGGQNG